MVEPRLPRRRAREEDLTVYAGAADHPAPGAQPPSDLRINMSLRRGRALVTIGGEIDLCTEQALVSALREAVGRGARGVDLDLTGTTFCDCSGLRALLAARHHAQRSGKTLTIRAASRPVQRLLSATGTQALFTSRGRSPHLPSERSILSAADTQEDALSRDEDLHTEVAQLRRAMQTRPVIDQAIGVLMASFRLSPEDAWNVLVAVSQNTNTKLHQLARQLVTAVQGSALDEAVQQHLGAALLALRTPTSPARQPAEEGDGCEEVT